jgi:hypothetical protein
LGNIASFAPLWIVKEIDLSILIDFLLDQNLDDWIVYVFFNILRSRHKKEIMLDKVWELEIVPALIQSLTFTAQSREREVSILICIYLLVSGSSSDIKELVQVLELKDILVGLNQANTQAADIISEILLVL